MPLSAEVQSVLSLKSIQSTSHIPSSGHLSTLCHSNAFITAHNGYVGFVLISTALLAKFMDSAYEKKFPVSSLTISRVRCTMDLDHQ